MYINKKIEITIIIFILLMLIILEFMNFKKSYNLENVLIFNLYENSKNDKYIFDIGAKYKQETNVGLYSTLKMESLANEKIAPGANGEFEIILTSSKNVGYQIRFESKNKKPQNLVFNIKNDFNKYSSLEELGRLLKGTLNGNIRKNIWIEWSWDYETTEYGNTQDTFDGENIKEYNFDINILSYKL